MLFFHGFRFAGFAGCVSPVATIRRPFGAKRHHRMRFKPLQAENNCARKFNRTSGYFL